MNQAIVLFLADRFRERTGADALAEPEAKARLRDAALRCEGEQRRGVVLSLIER
jgi:hypothetical protein